MKEQALGCYKGWIQHTRTSPKPHKFRYDYFQLWLDVEQPQAIDQISPFWSSNRFNLVRYQRQHYQPSKRPIHAEICHLIKQQTNQEFNGKIYLLGNLTYWGYCYNPVCFYFCYDEKQQLQYILSEIHNTPWGERFTYLHDVADSLSSAPIRKSSSHSNDRGDDTLRFKFDKKFHVSPFMPMDLEYDWRFNVSNEGIFISMNLQRYSENSSESIFNATMNLKSTPLGSKQARQIAFRYPWMCAKVMLSIYWQALRLWLKRIPFQTHPDKV